MLIPQCRNNRYYKNCKTLGLKPVMALIGCERCGRTEPPKIDQKVGPPAQEIALFFYSSTRTSMTCQKKRKQF